MVTTLWREYDKAQSEEKNENERTLFLFGSKSVGKTSLLYNFLEINEKPRETLTLEYSYGRKSNSRQFTEKLISHNWEFGGNLELLPKAITSINASINNGGYLTVILVLDLSKPKHLFNTFEKCYAAIEKMASITNLVIIGGKYDRFKEFDSNLKKIISTAMRSLALTTKSHLFYHSNMEPTMNRRMKDLFNFFAFGQGFLPRDKIISSGKPVSIVYPSDSWESIGINEISIEGIKAEFVSKVPQDLEYGLEVSTRLSRSSKEIELEEARRKKVDELLMLTVADKEMQDFLKNLL